MKSLVGLTEEEDISEIKRSGMITRIIRRDDETFMGTMDARSDRVNLEIESGKVAYSSIG